MADISEQTRATIAQAWPEIKARIAAGELIKNIIASLSISRTALFNFIGSDPQLRAEWTLAKEDSAASFMDMALEEAMADRTNLESAHIRTRIDTLKWAARIRNPQVYSDKAQLDVNVKTVDLTRIIEAANARVMGRVIPHNSGEPRTLSRAPAALPAPLEILARDALLELL
jgi:hypothetical protein